MERVKNRATLLILLGPFFPRFLCFVGGFVFFFALLLVFSVLPLLLALFSGDTVMIVFDDGLWF